MSKHQRLYVCCAALCCCHAPSAIQLLTKKVAELEAGLSALLSGQAIPPAAAAALIAAISKMGVPSSQLIQALSKAGVKVSSLAGAAASRGGSRGPGSRNPSEGAALAAGDGKRAASNEAEAKPQGAAARQAAAELDSVIQAINQVSERVDASHNVSLSQTVVQGGGVSGAAGLSGLRVQ